jgi:energy-coupling factor transporter ATP-binding protein EcfA2
MEALAGVDLEVGQDEFVCLIDPSASGKSTLLELLGDIGDQGDPSEGKILRTKGMFVRNVPLSDWIFKFGVLKIEIYLKCLCLGTAKPPKSDDNDDPESTTDANEDWPRRD